MQPNEKRCGAVPIRFKIKLNGMGNLILIFFAAYTILLFVVMWFSARKADNASYFTGNRKSPWFVVAYGMIGASLSGVTPPRRGMMR